MEYSIWISSFHQLVKSQQHLLLCFLESPEEAEGVGDKNSADAAAVNLQILVEASLNTSLRSACFIDEIFFLVKTQLHVLELLFCNAGLSGLRIIGHRIKGILL